MADLKRTPVFDQYSKYGGKIVEFGGYAMPVQFSSLVEEHIGTREFAGLFDVSHMGEIFVEGKDAVKFLNYVSTNDFSEMEKGQVMYTMICYEDGGIVDDVMVYCFEKDKYCVVVNASNIEKDFEWFIKNKKDFGVEILNASEGIALLALQGPYAEEILQKFTDTDLESIGNLKFKENVTVFGKDCLVSRSGYTGEDGFEIYCKAEDAAFLWNEILEKGNIGDRKVLPAGLGARDTLRFEAGLPLYGNELGKDIKAVETGMNFCIKLNKDDFIGKEALVKAKENLTRKLVGFELIGKGVPRSGYKIVADDEEIGYVTTGYIPPTVNKPIGMAYVNSKYAKIGEEITIMLRKRPVKAKIIGKKFYKRNK